MKISCLQEHLKQGLLTTERIVGRNITLPILNNVLLETEKGKLKISSTNLEIGINTWIACKTDKGGSITVPAKLISGFVSNLPNKKIDITLKNNNTLILESENYQTEIKGQPSQDFPIIPKIKGDIISELNQNDLKIGLSQVLSSASLSEAKPEFSGIYFKFENNFIKLTATDTFRLSEKTIQNQNKKATSFIVPQKTVIELARILNDNNLEKEKVSVILNENQVLFKIGDTEVISRLIEGQYPDYQQIIPKQYKLKITAEKKSLQEAIRAASLFSSKINDIQFLIKPNKKRIEIISKNPDVGTNDSTINCDIEEHDKGEIKEMMINFNYKYILDGLNNIPSSKIFIGVNNENQAVILKGVGDNSYLYIVMPLKIS